MRRAALQWVVGLGPSLACCSVASGTDALDGTEGPATSETSSDDASGAPTAAETSGTTAPSSGPDATSDATSDDGTDTSADGSETGEGPPESRCEVSELYISCDRESTELRGSVLYWQVPVGVPPAQGWPAVVLFHGSFFGPEWTWAGDTAMPFGGFHQLELQAMLLDHGFALITPTASSGVAWATNFPDYLGSEDHLLVLALLDAIAAGELGPIDTDRLYATGISSGGYMTSRMAVTYPGWFRALAIQSGSYATCTNLLCIIPDPLPADHPPTLFLHGQLDVAVPISTMYEYADRLDDQGLIHDEVVDPLASHRWLEQSPEEVLAWFQQHH